MSNPGATTVLVALLALAPVGALAATPDCRDALAEPYCAALPDPADELSCEDVLAEPLCDQLPSCEDTLPREACRPPSAAGVADPVLCPGAGASLHGGCVRWNRTLDRPGHEFLSVAATSPDGARVYLAGYAQGSTYDATVVAVDAATGEEAWRFAWDGGRGTDAALDVAVSPDGARLYVVGYTTASTSTDFLALALDAADGSVEWSHVQDGGASRPDFLRAVEVSADGGKVVAAGDAGNVFAHYHCWGCSLHYHLHSDLALLAFDAATGALVQGGRHATSYDSREIAVDVAASADGEGVYLLAETSAYTGGSADLYVVGHRGTSAWARALGEPGSYDDGVGLLLSSDEARVHVVGSLGGEGKGAGVVALDAANGATAWTAFAPFAAAATAATASPDGARVLVAAREATTPGAPRMAVFAVRALDGGVEWATARAEPEDSTAHPYDVAVSPDGARVFLVGVSSNATASGPVVLALDARTGAERAAFPLPGGVAYTRLAMAQADGKAVGVASGARLVSGDAAVDLVAFDVGLLQA